MAGELGPIKGDIPGTSSASFPPAPKRTPSRGNFSRAPGGDRIRNIKGRFTGGMAVNWIGLDLAAQDVKDIGRDAALAVARMPEQLAREIEAYAKQNAPWEDRTFEAREGLNATVVRNRAGEASIILAHGVEYGVYLENANAGEFSVIIPTMEHFAAQLGSRIWGQKNT